MPCSDGGWNDDIRRQKEMDDKKFGNTEISAKITDLAYDVHKLINRNNDIAKMLCGIMRICDESSKQFLCNNIEGLKSWWEEHKKFDESEGRF